MSIWSVLNKGAKFGLHFTVDLICQIHNTTMTVY